MANSRIYRVRGLKVGGVAIGGLTSLSIAPSFTGAVESSADGAYGVEDIDVFGLQLAVSLSTTDVTKLEPLMINTTGLTFECQESGALTGHTVTLTADAVIWNSFNLNMPYGADAVATLGGFIRMDEGAAAAAITAALSEVSGVERAAIYLSTTYPQTYPTRRFRPNTFSFLPTSGVAISPEHVESINLSCTGRIIQDSLDTDGAMSAIDLVDWGMIDCSILFKEATATAGDSIATSLIMAAQGALTCNLHGRAAGAADAGTLTLNALKWLSSAQSHGPEYSTYALAGKASWRLMATPFTAYKWVAEEGPPVYAALLAIT